MYNSHDGFLRFHYAVNQTENQFETISFHHAEIVVDTTVPNPVEGSLCPSPTTMLG
jgi:hypothetical protein